jgi:Ethanolamine utilization protein EutJ (predicted chaperonin)
VFRPVLVADGNFKADHVKQKNDNDVWLIDGAGMVPNQKEYSAFLKKALEIPTVRRFVTKNGLIGLGPGVRIGVRSRTRNMIC